MARPGSPPGRYRNAQAARDQPRHDVAPDETGAADDEEVGLLHKICTGRDSMPRPSLDLGNCARGARYGNSVVPATFGAIVPRRAFNDNGDALASNNAA